MQQIKEKEKLRVDKYLWAIRLFKTRSLATTACEQGRVKQLGISIKASKHINTGDELEVRTEGRRWVIKVTTLLDKRMQHAEAIKHYIDITPAEELERLQYEAAAFFTGKRNSKIGRPTKKQRRDLEDFKEGD
ncbi:MAG: S4 domain-containing protein [Flavitalea sp.]